MRRKWVSLAAVATLCWIFGSYQARSQTYPASASAPSTKPAPPAGRERALHFHSEITLHDDFSLTVTESIRVVVLGRVIKRGIIRDFPVQYRKKDGTKVSVPFEVVALLKNGRPEPYHVVGRGQCKRVYIGKKDVLLKPGVYTYTLVYRTRKQSRNHNNRHELHWTVAGNDWSFDMEQVSARIKLPEGIPLSKVRYVAHTGDKDAVEKGYRARIDGGERICFTTTRELDGDEDLTISLTWNKTADKQSTPLDDTTRKAELPPGDV